jgi:hypothetical protein
MNHYVAAALWMLAALGVPMLWVALGLPFNPKGGWWW